jgi:hypothetical protein
LGFLLQPMGAHLHHAANILPQLFNISNVPKQAAAMLKNRRSHAQAQPNKTKSATQTQNKIHNTFTRDYCVRKVQLLQSKNENSQTLTNSGFAMTFLARPQKSRKITNQIVKKQV